MPARYAPILFGFVLSALMSFPRLWHCHLSQRQPGRRLLQHLDQRLATLVADCLPGRTGCGADRPAPDRGARQGAGAGLALVR